jgi:hypothetical protein
MSKSSKKQAPTSSTGTAPAARLSKQTGGGDGRPLTCPDIFVSCFGTGFRPISWVTWMVRASVCSIAWHPPEDAGQRALDLGRWIADLRPGTMLGREWKGRMQRVAVLADGFAWTGETCPSLSKVAFAITGTRWNGPKFFGLRDQPSKDSSHEGRIGEGDSLRNLYPRLDRPGSRPRLQLTGRPI